MKAIEQCFPVLVLMLCKVVLTFKSVDEILNCDHSNENNCAIFPCITVGYALKDFGVCG